VTIFSLLLGYPLAYFLSFYAGKKKDLLYQLVIIPLWVSYLVRAYAWKTILGSDGVLNTLAAICTGDEASAGVSAVQSVCGGVDTDAHLHAVCVSAHLRGAGTHSAQSGGSVA
jgi:ABC-type Fe3+ transport system permease subunit